MPRPSLSENMAQGDIFQSPTDSPEIGPGSRGLFSGNLRKIRTKDLCETIDRPP